MNYTEFVTLIGQNTSNRLVDYKGLCRFCLKDQSDVIDISDDNSNTKIRRDMIHDNYVDITKQHLSIAVDYPNFVCSLCEAELSQYALFTRQIERNAENWEIFLKSGNDVKVPKDELVFTDYNQMNGIEEIKVEFCGETFVDIPDTYTYDALEVSPVKCESVSLKRKSLNLQRTLDDDKPKRRRTGKFPHKNQSMEYERTCQLCVSPTFASLARFYKHLQEEHPGEKRFSCDICDTKFNTKNTLPMHMKDRHSNAGKKHQCQFCSNFFYSDREMKEHEKHHLNARSYVCSLCTKGFNSKSELNTHLSGKMHNADYKSKEKSKNSDSKTYRCQQCVPSISFSSADERTLHRNAVHKAFECGVCKNTFITLESLQRHKLLHSDKPRSFVCSVCDATFKQSSHLRAHFKWKHTDEKKFSCTQCDKRFVEKYGLNAHINLVHSKKERVKCDQCECDFSNNRYLKAHISGKHSTEASPYDCKICGKRNANAAALDLHRLKFHKQIW